MSNPCSLRILGSITMSNHETKSQPLCKTSYCAPKQRSDINLVLNHPLLQHYFSRCSLWFPLMTLSVLPFHPSKFYSFPLATSIQSEIILITSLHVTPSSKEIRHMETRMLKGIQSCNYFYLWRGFRTEILQTSGISVCSWLCSILTRFSKCTFSQETQPKNSIMVFQIVEKFHNSSV